MRSTLSEMLPSGNSCWLILSILLKRSGSLLVNFFTIGEIIKQIYNYELRKGKIQIFLLTVFVKWYVWVPNVRMTQIQVIPFLNMSGILFYNLDNKSLFMTATKNKSLFFNS